MANAFLIEFNRLQSGVNITLTLSPTAETAHLLQLLLDYGSFTIIQMISMTDGDIYQMRAKIDSAILTIVESFSGKKPKVIVDDWIQNAVHPRHVGWYTYGHFMYIPGKTIGYSIKPEYYNEIIPNAVQKLAMLHEHIEIDIEPTPSFVKKEY